jgi:hypothetical protein
VRAATLAGHFDDLSQLVRIRSDQGSRILTNSVCRLPKKVSEMTFSRLVKMMPRQKP